MESNLIINEVFKFCIFILVAYLGGLLVSHKNVKVNYTRKINHFGLFFIPPVVFYLLPYEHDLTTLLMVFTTGLLTLFVYIEAIRSRIPFLNTAFSSMDRPEDRPYTLVWLWTQIAATSVIAVFLIGYLFTIGKMELYYVPVFINGIGDGLAEPIGVKFGKHKYETRALFSKRKYERSIEGSLCVFITGIITIIVLQGSFSAIQFVAALVVIPLITTIAEAFSPHTWDSPYLYLVSGISIFGILQI